MLKKLILCLLLALVLVVPASAWEQTWEQHSNDISQSYFSGSSGYSVSNLNHGKAAELHLNGAQEQYLNISRPFTGYLGFTYSCNDILYSSQILGSVTLYDTSGNAYFTSPFTIYTSSDDESSDRIEYVIDANKFILYQNGYPIQNVDYTSSSAPGSIKITFKTESEYQESEVYLDSFSTDFGVIDCDSSIGGSDFYQYYRVGHPVPSDSSWFVRLFGPNGSLITQYNISDYTPFEELSFEKSLLTDAGTYTIRLYQHDNLGGYNFYYGSRSFNYISETQNNDGVIELDKEDYLPSNIMNIWTHLDNYAPGYYVTTSINTQSGLIVRSYNITSEDQHGSIEIPSDAVQSGNGFIYLRDSSGQIAASQTYSIISEATASAVTLDKSTYNPGEQVIVSWKNNAGNNVNFKLRSGSNSVYTLSWDPPSIDGAYTFNLSELPAADSIYVSLTDVIDGTLKTEVSAKIRSGQYYLHGRVYDSMTGAAVDGAEVDIGGNTSTTNAEGDYGLSALAGRNQFLVLKEGYFDLSGQVPAYDLISYHDFYITPVREVSGASGIYGTVNSRITGLPIQGAHVQITNGELSYSAITDSRGFYSINHEGLDGTATVRVTKANYDTFTKDIPVSGFTYVNFNLVASSGYEKLEEDAIRGSNPNYDPNPRHEGLSPQEKEYVEKYGEYGQHPFDFNGDGAVTNEEWMYAVQSLLVVLFCLGLIGFFGIITGRRR